MGSTAYRDWTQGSIVRNLLMLSWPMVLTEGFAVVALTLDFVWVGRLGAAAIAGMGAASMLVILGMASGVGLIAGLRAMVARHVGAGDAAGANHTAQQALAVNSAIGIAMSVAGVLLAAPLVGLFGLEADAAGAGVVYLRVMFGGMTSFWLRIAADSTMQASGDTVTPMKITILTRGIHLVLAPAVIFGWWILPPLGVAGAALANVVAHTLAMLLGLWVLFTGRSRLRLSLAGFRLDAPVVWRMVRIGLPALVMTVQRSLGYIVLTALTAPFGTVAVAGHSLVQRVDTVLFMPSWALSSGAGVLVGQNLGAGQPGRAERNAWLATGLVEGLMLAGALVAVLWAEGVVGLFSTDPDLVRVGGSFIRIAAAGYAVMAFVIVLQQAMAGAGDTLPAMLISVLMVWVVQVPLAYGLSHFAGYGVYGIRWSMALGIVAGAVASAVYFRLGRWKQRRV